MTSFLLSSSGFAAMVCIFIVGAFLSLTFSQSPRLANVAGSGLALLGSLLGVCVGGAALFSGTLPTFTVSSPLPLLSLSIVIDPLSAFFMIVISIIAAACSIYAFGYVKHLYATYSIGALGFFYNLFILGMLLVATVHSVVAFLIVWEIMSLTSFFLVMFEYKESANVRAGLLYFVMTHAGTACIMLALLLLSHATGSYDFETIHAHIGLVSPLLLSIVFIASLIGFGIKSGIIPLHIWLPSAHPAAPSHVSALMSGVMIKTGIYMFVRLYLDILPPPPLWWGALILIIGIISSVLGVLYALSEHDLKRLLAYHSIENIGIILLGLGSSMIFLSLHMPNLALLGIIAALFHTLNHAVFKALLFLGAGSVVSQMHTRNMEEYGGLMRYMPITGFAFLVGAIAISGLPPLNGFFSEWITFQTMFAGAGSSNAFIKTIFVLGIGGLGATSGFAAACFVKAVGATFLARPRSEEVRHAKEASFSMQLSMLMLACATLVIGASAGFVVSILARVGASLGNLPLATLPGSSTLPLVDIRGFATLSMPMLALAIAGAILGTFLIIKILTYRRVVVRDITWDCGTALTPRMEITATSFSHSIITVMRGVLRPTRQHEVEYHDASLRYFPKASTMHFGIEDIYLTRFYQPLQQIFIFASKYIRRLQQGNINAYVLYIFLTLLAALFLVL
jgi:hydrogenase-4 component B